MRGVVIFWALELAVAIARTDWQRFFNEETVVPLLSELRATTFVQIALLPFFPVRMMVEASSWPAFLGSTLAAVSVAGAFFGLIFWINHDFRRESLITTSRRERAATALRRGEGNAYAIRGERHWALPDLPFWRGAGPVAWMHLTAALRYGIRGVLAIGAIVIIVIAGIEWFAPHVKHEIGPSFMAILAVYICVITAFGVVIAPGRGLEHWKAFPLSPMALMTGRLGTESLTCLGGQALILGMIAVWCGQVPVAAAALVFFLPANLLLASVGESLRFSLPSLRGSRPTELLMMLFATILVGAFVLICAATIAAAAAWTVGVWTGRAGYAAAAAWLSLFFLALAFLRVAAACCRQAGPDRISPE